MLIECSECQFLRIISPDDDELPAEIVIEHGKKTGHTLSTEPVDDEAHTYQRTK